MGKHHRGAARVRLLRLGLRSAGLPVLRHGRHDAGHLPEQLAGVDAADEVPDALVEIGIRAIVGRAARRPAAGRATAPLAATSLALVCRAYE